MADENETNKEVKETPKTETLDLDEVEEEVEMEEEPIGAVAKWERHVEMRKAEDSGFQLPKIF